VFGSVLVLSADAMDWRRSCRRLRAAGLYPEVVALGHSLDAHRAAWRRVVVREEAALVVTDDVLLADPWAAAVERAAEALVGTAWHVVHLDAAREGSAYVVTPEGASLLLAVEDGPVDERIGELMSRAGPLEVLGVEPPLAVLADSAGDDVVRDDVVRDDDAPVDDLMRLLRYQDAIGIGEGLTIVADELVTVPFWTPDFCTSVVRAAEALDAWGSDELDPVPGDEVSLAVLLPRLFAHVEDHLAASIVPQLRAHWPTLEFHGLRDAFVIRYTADAGEGLRLHHDVAHVSGSVRLNDRYTGGELVFPRQDATNRGVAVGALLAWPSLVTHPHAALPVESGVKYGLTIWCEVPGVATR
jgi:hypothetical protein